MEWPFHPDLQMNQVSFEVSKSLHEAIFNRVPVISSNVGVLNETLSDKETALFFEFEDVAGLSTRIAFACENPGATCFPCGMSHAPVLL